MKRGKVRGMRKPAIALALVSLLGVSLLPNIGRSQKAREVLTLSKCNGARICNTGQTINLAAKRFGVTVELPAVLNGDINARANG